VNTEAWLVVGERHHREVTMDHAVAVDHAAKHHGVFKALVLAEDVEAMCREAFERGRRSALLQGES
jgi:hypothetical protein